ncbi:large ribosomal subunit protein uL10m-like [Glandiceps talaboti]
MAAFTRIPLWSTPWAFIRHGMKGVNTRKKRPLPFVKAKMLAVTQAKPIKDNRSLAEQCAKKTNVDVVKATQENPWKELLKREAKAMMEENQLVVVFHDCGVTAMEKRQFRRKLRKQGLDLMWYPNLVMTETLEGSKYENMMPLIVGMNLYATCPEPKVKELLKAAKNVPKIYLLGGKVEENLMSVTDMVKFSQLPSLQTLQGELVGTLSTPLHRLSSLLQANQQRLTMNLDQYIKQMNEETEQKNES